MQLEIPIKCPNCGRTLKQQVSGMHPGASRRCSCGLTIKFAGDDGRKTQKAVDDLKRSLKRLSSNFRLR
jgi:hypothetical protein